MSSTTAWIGLACVIVVVMLLVASRARAGTKRQAQQRRQARLDKFEREYRPYPPPSGPSASKPGEPTVWPAHRSGAPAVKRASGMGASGGKRDTPRATPSVASRSRQERRDSDCDDWQTAASAAPPSRAERSIDEPAAVLAGKGGRFGGAGASADWSDSSHQGASRDCDATRPGAFAAPSASPAGSQSCRAAFYESSGGHGSDSSSPSSSSGSDSDGSSD